MGKRILILDAHPATGSLVGALATSYREGAHGAGHAVCARALRDMAFDPILHEGYRRVQELEPDLADAQQDILWCEHLVIAYPTWWGQPPALLKGFLDRTFLPGFAFKYRENSSFWDRLLAGRSARLLVTMDAPPMYDRVFYGGRRLMKRAVLRFCGFRPVRSSAFGSVKGSSDAARARWVEKARTLGERAA
jgi:putative NADPH-quinone reductase